MRQNLYLVLFGSLVGAGCIGALYFCFPHLFSGQQSAGTTFESIDALRHAMTDRDARDSLPGGDVSLRMIVRPNPADNIIYELIPNNHAQFRHVRISTNQFGMRSPELSLEKPPHTKRIAVLGDSYAFGWGVEDEKVFSRVMEERLNRGAPTGERVEVLNFGVPGYATFQEVGQFLATGVSFRPDAVLVYFIHNDFGLPFFIHDLENTSRLATAPEFERARVNPEDRLKQQRRAALLRSLDASRPLLQLATYCRDHQIALFLALHPDEHERAMLQRLWVLAKRPGKRIIRRIELAASDKAAVSAHDVSEGMWYRLPWCRWVPEVEQLVRFRRREQWRRSQRSSC